MKYLAMKPRPIETILLIKNLMPMILKPSPSSLGEIMLVPIQLQIMPNAPTIIPATKSGLNNMVESLAESDIAFQHTRMLLLLINFRSNDGSTVLVATYFQYMLHLWPSFFFEYRH